MMEQQDDKPAPQAQPAVLTMTIHITRKATGVTETYEVIGTPVKQDEPEESED